ncbi:transposase DDE domain protein [Orientia tsutsugamushi str. Kato PP]|uniref:Transposase n=1 Tax=Orientia tsutsugamushi TaxID=784 RepID=A0A2U3QZ04_ORITS|nr:transposase DDE domain protein [Orientia tsutsugamushi str. Kato PP]SPR06214.1 transposase [Orientia tsutsugamushi]
MGLRLFTNLRKDMKTYLLDIQDNLLLNKRSLIESVFNVLKKHMLLEHTRHRSPKEEKLTQIAVDNRSIQVRLLYFLLC